MHMQHGIGRAGMVLLSLVTLAIGAFGLTLAWTAFNQGAATFFAMGLGVAAVALGGLFLFALVGPSKVRARALVQPEPEPAPEATAAPERVAPRESKPSVDYEFKDFTPAARAAPEALQLPDAFQEKAVPEPVEPVEFQPKKDPASWPGKRGKSTWTTQVEHQRNVATQVEDARRRHDLTEKYTRTTPTLRAILDEGVDPVPQPRQAPTQTTQVQKPAQTPERLADRAPRDMNTDFVAPGMSVGKCGQCGTKLLAPEERPLRLKCPECAKVTLLQ